MPAQIFNYIVCIHLLILTYKYHCLYELWFMSCMHDSLFVTGNDFMMLAFFFNLITYVFEYLIWFLTSLWLLCHKPFHPRFTYSWFMENQAGKNIQLWLFFFFSSQRFQQSSVITNHCTNKTKNWISWWPWGKTSVLA